MWCMVCWSRRESGLSAFLQIVYINLTLSSSCQMSFITRWYFNVGSFSAWWPGVSSHQPSHVLLLKDKFIGAVFPLKGRIVTWIIYQRHSEILHFKLGGYIVLMPHKLTTTKRRLIRSFRSNFQMPDILNWWEFYLNLLRFLKVRWLRKTGQNRKMYL